MIKLGLCFVVVIMFAAALQLLNCGQILAPFETIKSEIDLDQLGVIQLVSLCAQQMQNKKQFRLKTVFAEGWIEPKSTAALHSLFTIETKPHPQINTNQSSKKRLLTTTQKRSNSKMQQLVLCRTERDQNLKPLYNKSSLKQFPKRESVVKNSNPFRYFMGSNSRVSTEPARQELLFHKKMGEIIKEAPCDKIIGRFQLKVEKSRLSDSRQLKRQKKIKQSKKRNTVGDNQCIEPWRLKEEHDLNDLNVH